jgi:hypothetical protein
VEGISDALELTSNVRRKRRWFDDRECGIYIANSHVILGGVIDMSSRIWCVLLLALRFLMYLLTEYWWTLL